MMVSMSRLNFHSVDRTVEVHGSERANFSYIISEVGLRELDPANNHIVLSYGLAKSRRSDSYREGQLNLWLNDFSISNRVSEFDFFIENQAVSSFGVNLNTVMSVGDNAMKLIARLHAQCEYHCWVAGENRAWLADIIENASETLFRPNSGWDEVIELLRESDEGAVVVSESIGDIFPNFSMAEQNDVPDIFPSVEDGDAEDEYWAIRESDWYDKPAVEKWEDGMGWLVQQQGMLEMKPENWDNYRFSHKFDAAKLLRELTEQYYFNLPKK